MSDNNYFKINKKEFKRQICSLAITISTLLVTFSLFFIGIPASKTITEMMLVLIAGIMFWFIGLFINFTSELEYLREDFKERKK